MSITTNFFNHYLCRTEDNINYKNIRLWFRKNPLYLMRDDVDKRTSTNDFLHIHKSRRDSEREIARERERESLREREREKEKERKRIGKESERRARAREGGRDRVREF